MTNDLVLLGRGPSVYETDLPSADIMAVSSGVYAVPEDRTVKHFVSLDLPKYFLAPLMGRYDIAWQNDKRSRVWPFWSDPNVIKHVAAGRKRNGFVRMIPVDLFDRLPEHLQKWREPMKDALLEQHHEIGFQPGWADYPNVRGWHVVTPPGKVFAEGTPPDPLPQDRPNFDDPSKPLQMNGVRNSLIMAVQIAHLLGYTRLYFAGIDLRESGYEVVIETLQQWHCESKAEWINLAPKSALAKFLPTLETVSI
jgi:hypothetical protein